MDKNIVLVVIMLLTNICQIRSQDILVNQAPTDQKVKTIGVIRSNKSPQSETQSEKTTTYEDLVQNCFEVKDDRTFAPSQVFVLPTLSGKMEEKESWKIAQILNLDVMAYYGKKYDYDTDLKRKIYKQSEEYKKLEADLKNLRQQFIQSRFYYIRGFYQNYNLDKKAFPFEKSIYEDVFPNLPGYVVMGSLCIEYATKRFPKNKIYYERGFGGTNYFIDQTIFLPVKDENKALEIENAKSDKAILCIFKLTKSVQMETLFSPKDFILTNIESIYLINKKTKEVYCKIL
jgi:hypothetical protein